MDCYCKQIAKFMQAQPHCNYDIRSSKKRSREPEQQEGTSPQVIPPVLDKWKSKINPDPSNIKVSSNKERNNSEAHTEKEAPVLLKTIGGKEGEAEPGGTEKV